MDYYFSASSNAEALRATDLPGGPKPGSENFDSVEAKDVMGTALEELVALASGKGNQFIVARTLPLWPEIPTNPDDYEPGPILVRLPDSLRDELVAIELMLELATKWANDLYGYEPEDALRVARSIIQLARAGRENDRSIYWWSEL